jgi:hypothetical protein
MLKSLVTIVGVGLLEIVLVCPSYAQTSNGISAEKALVLTQDEKNIDAINSVPQLLDLAARYETNNDWKHYAAAMSKILKLRPYASNIKLELAAAYAMQGEKSKAYEVLLHLKETGYGADLQGDLRYKNLHGTEVWDFLIKGFSENSREIQTGSLAFDLPGKDLLIDALAWDNKRNQLLIGSIRTGEVLLAQNKGSVKSLIKPTEKNGLLGITAMLADTSRDALWVASSGSIIVKHAKAADYGKTALFKFRLSTGDFIQRWSTPDKTAVALDSLTLASNGDVYAADSLAKTIFRFDGSQLQLIAHNPRLTMISSIAVSGDNKLLYFSDYELGVFTIDLGAGKPAEVKVAKYVNLFGIDSLYWRKGFLIAIQTGFTSKQITQFKLTDDGQGIVQAKPIDRAVKTWGDLSQGVLVDDRLYFIVNSQKSGYDMYGVPKDASKLEQTKVWMSVLPKAE